MDRRTFLSSSLALVSIAQRARGAGKMIFRIGFVTAQREPSLAPFVGAFRAGLDELGYVENVNLEIIYRYGDDDVTRVPRLAAELVTKPVDVLVVQGSAATVVNELKLSTPAIYVFSGDPVLAGLASSLSHPGGNMTGLTLMAAELNAKRLQILRDAVPSLQRVAIIGNPEHPGSHVERVYSEETAKRLGIAADFFGTATQDQLTSAFAAMNRSPPQAISLFADGFAIQNRAQIIEFAMQHRVPVISGWPIFARSGALCTYGPKLSDSYHRLASYVDRILKGARPQELPVERPTNFETVLNLRTAKALGLDLPPSILASADEVIE
ncbi:ABC transporter substrate-binding protein [Bradyrhizobium guangdongense]